MKITDIIFLSSYILTALISSIWFLMTLLIDSKKKYRSNSYVILLFCISPFGFALPILAIVLGFGWLFAYKIPELLKTDTR